MKDLLLIILSINAAFGADSIHAKANIDTYHSGEFAVKGIVEQQLGARVIAPLSASLPKTGDGEISIVVTGYADRSGAAALNDQLAKNRADEVRANLLVKFPKANIVSRTKGDALNAKMVTVEWTITPTVRPIGTTPRKTALNRWVIIPFALAIMLAIVSIMTLAANTRGKTVDVVKPPTTVVNNLFVMPIPEQKTSPVLIEEEMDGIIYSFTAPLVDGVWVTPFMTADGLKPSWRKSEKAMSLSLRGYLKKEACRPMIEKLIAEGKIQTRNSDRRTA